MSQNPSMAVGQVSADGQFRWDGAQWVPIPRGEREPTPWTRPMQLVSAAILAVEAVTSVAGVAIFYTHDQVKKTLEAAGTQVPQGTTEDQLITITIVSAIAFASFFGLLELFGALGAVLRWRWAFWYVLVLFGLGTVSAIAGLISVLRTNTSPVPVGIEIFQELVALATVVVFVWMLIGVIRFGPWAMKRPGA